MRNACRLTLLLLTAALPLAAAACAAAAAGTAGAAGAVYYSERGAESNLNAPLNKTTQAVRNAFKELNITETRSSSKEGLGETTRVLEGTTPGRDVKVTIKAEGNKSQVKVFARKSAVTWDKDLAKAILQRVVSLAG